MANRVRMKSNPRYQAFVDAIVQSGTCRRLWSTQGEGGNQRAFDLEAWDTPRGVLIAQIWVAPASSKRPSDGFHIYSDTSPSKMDDLIAWATTRENP